jgi:hypothetical protein
MPSTEEPTDIVLSQINRIHNSHHTACLGQFWYHFPSTHFFQVVSATFRAETVYAFLNVASVASLGLFLLTWGEEYKNKSLSLRYFPLPFAISSFLILSILLNILLHASLHKQ